MGKKGGGGGGSTPSVQIPAGINQTAATEAGLGQYASSLLNPLASMTNWAANLASGGNAGQIPTFQSQAIQAGPQAYFSGGRKPWSSSFDPQTGLITYTGDSQSQQFTVPISAYTPGGNNNPAWFGNMPVSVLNQWKQDYAQNKSGTSAGGSTGQNLTSESALGPFLSSAWNAIQTQEGLPAQMIPIEQQTANLENQAATEGESMMQMATTGSGLFPSQQAYVTQAQQTGETNAAAELAKLGLSNSTMAPQLQEQADLAASATAGTLVQGNIQLAQASQNIALGAQTLETGEQQAVFDMYANIANESAAFQTNLWNEAMQGYGTLGSILDTAAKNYEYSLSGYESVLQAQEQNAQLQAQQQEAAAQADSQASAGLLGGIGKLIGGLGGAGGGAAGILGSAGGASLGAGEAATAAVGGGSGLIAGVGGALTALFCQVAQTVYGFDNPKWTKFRAWLLLRAPLWLVRLYGRHAATVSDWLSDKPAIRWCVAQAMDLVSQC